MIGIIAEGPSDAEVVKSVLIGTLGIESGQIRTLLPSDSYDASQLAAWGIDPNFSNWTLVIEECKSKKLITDFIDALGNESIIIHLDTDKVEEPNYCGSRPTKDKNNLEQYSISLRDQIVQSIDQWLGSPYNTKAAHAIAIEEIEAWLIPLFESNLRKDTCEPPNAKSRLEKLLSKQLPDRDHKAHYQKSAGDRYTFLSKSLRQKRHLTNSRNKSKSLDLFCEELEQMQSSSISIVE
jgi:hypothetical protein